MPTELLRPIPAAIARPRFEGPDVLGHYLATLGSKKSRSVVLGILTRCARELARLEGVDGSALRSVSAVSYAWSAPGAITYERANALVAIIAQRHPASARLALAALRGLARAAHNLRVLPVDERQRIEDIRPPRLSGARRGRALTEREIGELYRACRRDRRPLGRRDAALVAVMLGAGLRRFEVVALDLADYRPPSERAAVPYLVVREGKGRQYAEVPMPRDAGRAVEDWIAARGRAEGPLFPSCQGRGRELAPGSRLTTAGLYQILARRAAQAGIAATAPHDLRRTMITHFLEATGDLALAQRQARHASPTTTAVYDRRGAVALERVLEVASTGYQNEG